MTVRRGPLYAGVFLLAAGAVTLGVATGTLDRAVVAETVGALWPLAVIAIGVGLVLRRSPAALGSGSFAALLSGLALGASIVAVPDLPGRWMDDAWVLRRGSAWETPGYDTTPFRAGLAIDTGIVSVTINPEGGSK